MSYIHFGIILLRMYSGSDLYTYRETPHTSQEQETILNRISDRAECHIREDNTCQMRLPLDFLF